MTAPEKTISRRTRARVTKRPDYTPLVREFRRFRQREGTNSPQGAALCGAGGAHLLTTPQLRNKDLFRRFREYIVVSPPWRGHSVSAPSTIVSTLGALPGK